MYFSIMLRSVSRSVSGDWTSISINRDLRFAGRSFLPTSVAGFIQAKIRKSGWRVTGSNDPCSVRVIEEVSLWRRLEIHSKVSALARLISSRRILCRRVRNVNETG
jgi:hypothetical protein